ncbi:hypothetical protein Sango_1368800 [Sesamum angolense]|uniref:U3 small nucleolar RNA-associated protein 6 N-terminal domain-containing protein n=1 Tax=Sesamum angolense TaxID=2727404 RepID=A0AAE1WSM5_9LAMI|nr:hypothetical protein Sango_1368800 [Sesamum angolense]
MADVVQFKLERMLNELEDLERRGLFSRREIAEIVKKRRKFEYRLKRPSPLKQDFLAYIDYEKQLDALRRLRKKSVLRKSGGKKSKKSVSDYAGVSRILDIYRLATNRFKGDIQLWFQYLEYCRARGHGRIKKALAQLVRFHPKVPGVWIYAAAWEFDNNLNVAAARALMQNGLRACPTSEDLWVEYLRMELTYLNKLKARKVALGEDEGDLARDHRKADEKQWRDENKELFMALNESGDADKRSDLQDGECEGKLDVFREHGLNILQAVYSGAIEALPTSFSIRTRDFSKEPLYWDWLARADLEGINAKQFSKAVQVVYEEGMKFVPSAVMVELYVKFLMDAISDEDRVEKLPCTSDLMAIQLNLFHIFRWWAKILRKSEKYFDKLVETSLPLLAKDGGSDSGFLTLPHPGLAIYRNCIELELNLALTGEKTGLPKARKLYESALATYDQDASLWQDYHSIEVQMGTSETAAAVHWRARKALKNNISLLSSATS